MGEKLTLVAGFRPFLENAAADILHPDLVYAGGITGTKRIANFAAMYRIPVALHNVGHLVNTLAAAHFGCSVQNFYRSESRLGEGARPVEAQAAGEKPEIKGGRLTVPENAGLGRIMDPPPSLHCHLAAGDSAHWGGGGSEQGLAGNVRHFKSQLVGALAERGQSQRGGGAGQLLAVAFQ